MFQQLKGFTSLLEIMAENEDQMANERPAPDPNRSASANVPDVCRVCQEPEVAENMISPCLCSGTIKYVHRECLTLHMRSSKKLYRCSTCHGRYRIRIRIIRKSMSELLRVHPKKLVFICLLVIAILILILNRIHAVRHWDLNSVNQHKLVRRFFKNGLNKPFFELVRKSVICFHAFNMCVIVVLVFMVVYGIWKIDFNTVDITD